MTTVKTTGKEQEIHYVEEHVHSVQWVRPDLAAGVTVTAGGVAWTYGALSADLIAAAAEANEFDIHFIEISGISANTDYQLALVAGASTVIAEATFTRASPILASLQFAIQTPVQPAGTRIRAKLASAAGGGETLVLKVHGHSY